MIVLNFLVPICGVISILFSVYQFRQYLTSSSNYVPIPTAEQRCSSKHFAEKKELLLHGEIKDSIQSGVYRFLQHQFGICLSFSIITSLLTFLVLLWTHNHLSFALVASLSLFIGSSACALCSSIGSFLALESNTKTSLAAQHHGLQEAFNVAFRAGSANGFMMAGIGVISIYCILSEFHTINDNIDDYSSLCNSFAAFSFGASLVSLFARIGGGIFMNSSDIAANLIGKVVHNISEDDPRNPAVIADLVGDIVGNVSGMGSDIFGSWAASIFAVIVLTGQIDDILLKDGFHAIIFPLLISCGGLVSCGLASFVATHIFPVQRVRDIDMSLRLQILLCCILTTPVVMLIAKASLPPTFRVVGHQEIHHVKDVDAAVCVMIGVIGGLLFGLITECYTSHQFFPVQELVMSATAGGATEIMHGLSLGYRSVIPSTIVFSLVVFSSFKMADIYGLALAAMGMMAVLPIYITIATFGAVCENAVGICGLAGFTQKSQDKSRALDNAGSNLSAIVKGYANCSALLSSLALFGAFALRIRDLYHIKNGGSKLIWIHLSLLEPVSLVFMLVGASLPFWVSGITLRGVCSAVVNAISEVERQFQELPELLNSEAKGSEEEKENGSLLPPREKQLLPEYQSLNSVLTTTALQEMMGPTVLILLTPVMVGLFFGVHALLGLLAGCLLSCSHLAVSMCNTGSAWNSAKRCIALQEGGRDSEVYKATIIGDTIGDPLKDTTGPSLNILIKLMTIISLVFADFFFCINGGSGLLGTPLREQ